MASLRRSGGPHPKKPGPAARPELGRNLGPKTRPQLQPEEPISAVQPTPGRMASLRRSRGPHPTKPDPAAQSKLGRRDPELTARLELHLEEPVLAPPPTSAQDPELRTRAESRARQPVPPPEPNPERHPEVDSGPASRVKGLVSALKPQLEEDLPAQSELGPHREKPLLPPHSGPGRRQKAEKG